MSVINQWTSIVPLAVDHLLRRFRCSQLDGSYKVAYEGVNALNGTVIQTFHQQLLQIGLPFRINVSAVLEVVSVRDNLNERYGCRLPPVSVNPLLQHGMASWADFLHLLRSQLTILAEELHGTPSAIVFQGIAKLELTYVPQDNLAAFQPHLHAMGGGAPHELPPDLVAKTCVLNILNEDDQCLRCSLLSWKLEIYKEDATHARRCGKYLTNIPKNGTKPKGWKPEYLDCSLNLMTLPLNRASTFDDLTHLEFANPGLGIYTVNNISHNFQVIARMPPDPLKVKEEVFLLLHNKHWCLITNFQRFASQQNFEISCFAGTSHHASFRCHRCLMNFGTEHTLKKHINSCNGSWEHKAEPPRLPSVHRKDPRDKTRVFFENWHHTFMHELVVYADIETFFSSLEEPSKLKAYGENRAIASIGMHAVAREGLSIPEEFQATIFINDGICDPFFEFMRKLLRLCIYWRFCKKNVKQLVMKPVDQEAFDNARYCQHCQEVFGRYVVKCKDHNHYTGEYRSALCSPYNVKASTPRELRVFTHNGTGYDHHFFIMGLARLAAMDMNLRTFTGVPTEWLAGDKDTHFDVDFSAFKLDVLAESSEKLRCIQFGMCDIKIMFLDSCKFLKGSLESLIESQTKATSGDLSSGFRNMTMHHPMICNYGDVVALDRLKLLLKKIPYPYMAMKNTNFWTEDVPIDKKDYYNELRQKEIKEADHLELLHIIAVLGITTGRHLHDVYLHTDVLALADVCETFRDKFHDTSGLDPFHKLGLPGAAWDNLFRNSGADIELITDGVAMEAE